MFKKIIYSILLVLLNISASFAQDKIIGFWNTENNEAKVQIYQSGNLIYGKIVSVSNTKNSSKVGLVILKSFTPNGNEYLNGTIIEPRHNHSADGKLTLSKDGVTLKVKGTTFVGLISKTENWTKTN